MALSFHEFSLLGGLGKFAFFMQLNYQSREEQSLKSNLYLNAKSLTTYASQMYNDYDSDSPIEFEIVYTLPQGYIMGQIFKTTNPNDSRDEFLFVYES